MKRKEPGSRKRNRERSKQEADDARLLRTYARFQYTATRQRIAAKAKVDLSRIVNKGGHLRAIRAGLKELQKWFHGLPEGHRSAARVQLQAAIDGGVSTVDESVDEKVMKANTPNVDRLIAKAKEISGQDLEPKVGPGGGGSKAELEEWAEREAGPE